MLEKILEYLYLILIGDICTKLKLIQLYNLKHFQMQYKMYKAKLTWHIYYTFNKS